MFFQQIEKFQCLKSSITQGLSHGIFRTHLTRVTCPETCLIVCQLQGPKSPKTKIIWFDSQLGLLVYPLSFPKIYVTSLGEFSTLIEAAGEVCNGTYILENFKNRYIRQFIKVQERVKKRAQKREQITKECLKGEMSDVLLGLLNEHALGSILLAPPI